MRIRNNEESPYDNSGNSAPFDWYGSVSVDGDRSPWRDAPIGSRYTCNLSGSEALWIKVASNQDNADWLQLGGTTLVTSSAGSLTIGADTDEDGDGAVVFQTKNVTRLTITNSGDLQGVLSNICLGQTGNAIVESENNYSCVIAGGGDPLAPHDDNNTIADNSNLGTISGGYDQHIGEDSRASTIGGGGHNEIGTAIPDPDNIIVGRGALDAYGSTHCVISGGSHNRINGDADTSTGTDYATIAGGTSNWILSDGGFIGGGKRNWIEESTTYAVIAGGDTNTASASGAVIGGGANNEASGSFSTIAGGGGARDDDAVPPWNNGNIASGDSSVIGGGQRNTASGNWGVVAGGVRNTASGSKSFVGGGGSSDAKTKEGNVASGALSVIVGGLESTADGDYAFIGSGYQNIASGDYAVVVSGKDNEASANYGSIGGGQDNEASGAHSTVAGGQNNTASNGHAAIAGGYTNTASNTYTTIGGGINNTASANQSTVGGGSGNTASDVAATVAGGNTNTASADYSTVGGGFQNTSSGDYGTVPGGRNNTASGAYSIATGRRAVASIHGSHAHASGYFSADGDAQTSVVVAKVQTASNAQTTLLVDGLSHKLAIPADTTWLFDVLVVARRTDANDESAAYRLLGCIDSNTAEEVTTVALVGSVTQTVIAEDTAATGWDATAEADNTNKTLVIKVTGENAKTINWVARVTLVQVTG